MGVITQEETKDRAHATYEDITAETQKTAVRCEIQQDRISTRVFIFIIDSSDLIIPLINRPKAKDNQVSVIDDKGRDHILTFEKLEA